MLINVKKTWKDLVEGPKHAGGFTRRDFMMRGLATGVMTVAVNKLLLGDLVKQAMAGTGNNCPTPYTNPGAIAHVFAEGGPAAGARFIGEDQMAIMNATIASNYGIGGTNLKKLGHNAVVDATSAFGFTLMQGPPGYAGGSSGWQTSVLNKISVGMYRGPFNQDDGAGVDTGLMSSVSSFRASQMGKDIKFNTKNQFASWGKSSPSVSTSTVSPAGLEKAFALTPAASGLATVASMTSASDAANSLGQLLAGSFGTNVRKGASVATTNAGCAFYGNSALVDPNYGATLFDPTGISALTSKMTVSSLTGEQQAQLSAYYQSAMGVAGGVISELSGRDYHGNDPQTDIGPKDIEDASALVMFLAACDAAGQKGAFIYTANGQTTSNGAQAITATVFGQSQSMTAPIATGDAGGAYNNGWVLFYDPKGAPPVTKVNGTISSSSGNATMDPNIGSSINAIAGLYISAHSWVGGSVPSSLASALSRAGISASPSSLAVI